MFKSFIDLNLDAGEFEESLINGAEEELYKLISSVNIACGGHAGDTTSMRTAVKLAMKHRLAIGAHPSYPDKKNFGREILVMPAAELKSSLKEQILSLKRICEQQKTSMNHIKPHGALYNFAAEDVATADALIAAIEEVDRNLCLVGFAGSTLLRLAKEAGIRGVSEGFVDRRYERNGSLVSRHESDALISDPVEAAKQALQISMQRSVTTRDGATIPLFVETLCIHGDGPNALAVATEVRKSLLQNGFRIQKSQQES